MSPAEWVAVLLMLSVYGVVGFILWRNPDVRAAVGPGGLDARMRKWLITRHAPQDLGPPGEPALWCFACRKSWPCAEGERLVSAEKTGSGHE